MRQRRAALLGASSGGATTASAGLFLVLALFAVLYAILFPGILGLGAASKFVQGWFPTALVAAAETILMLTGGIGLSVGPMVSLGSVVAASTMQGPLGVVRRRACAARARRRRRRVVGAFVAIGRFPAIIVTLAVSFVLRGVALLLLPRPGGFVPPSLSDFLAGVHPTAAALLVLLVVSVEALSGDAARRRPDRGRRERRGRLPLRRHRHRGADVGLCRQRHASGLRRAFSWRRRPARAIR